MRRLVYAAGYLLLPPSILRFRERTQETTPPDYFVDAAVARGKLVSVLDKFKPNVEPIWLVYGHRSWWLVSRRYSAE
jgi:hypothetical protein